MSALLIRSIFIISGAPVLNEGVRDSTDAKFDTIVPQKYIDSVSQTLFDCHYHILDGFQYLVTKFYNSDLSNEYENHRIGWVPPIVHRQLKSHFPDHVDLNGIFVPLEVENSFHSSKEKELQIWQTVSYN